MIAPTTKEVLALAAHVLVRRAGGGASYRCKHRAAARRVTRVEVRDLADAGLIEIGPRQRWARLTQAGREALGSQS